MADHKETIKKEFAKQAKRFGESGLTLSSQEYLQWMVKSLPLHKSFRVLDVAAGTGHLSRAIAHYVREVVSIDTTPEMLNEAKKEIEKARLSNIILVEGLAESLPFADNLFDMVVSRLAIHHFENPHICIDEMSRVCKTGHVVGIFDLLSPKNSLLSERYNYFERLRDPSHTIAATFSEINKMIKKARLSIRFKDFRDIEVDLHRWMDMTNTKREVKKEIENALTDEINGGEATGMRPFIEDNTIKFMQTWAIIIGEKIS
jgi:ubiquinone/menaquinone biosynthesis C-methylase UbiE